ncbi:MAG: hypothetical protein ACE5FL_06345 [Myxococcota bacterium]
MKSYEGQTGIAISAKGGIVIGLSLATAVILSGFSLVLGTHATADPQAFPAWVDQRFASEGPYQTMPASPGSTTTIVVADANAAGL